MKLNPGICPNCGAVITVDKDERVDICPYCDELYNSEESMKLFNKKYTLKNKKSDFEMFNDTVIGYHGLSTDVVIPYGVKIIGFKAFDNKSITSVKLPGSVETIEQYAFNNCSSLEDVKFGNNIKSIESGAFEDCSSLCEIHLPKSLEFIAEDSFEGCNNLNKVYVYSDHLNDGKDVNFIKHTNIDTLIVLEEKRSNFNEVIREYNIRENYIISNFPVCVNSVKNLYTDSGCLSMFQNVKSESVDKIYLDGIYLDPNCENDDVWLNFFWFDLYWRAD